MPAHVLGNVLIYLALVLLPSAVLWLLFKSVGWVGWALDRRRSRRARAAGPPIERLAADLRRVDRAIRALPEGASAVRRRGAQQAYDDLLRQACRALDVPDALDTLPNGIDRELERARVEVELQRAGLVIR